jgi:acyl-CoA thioesterase-1
MSSSTCSISKSALLGLCSVLLGPALVAEDASAQEALVVALGDSNTAGSGVGRGAAFPARLNAMLHGRGYGVRVTNAGVGGDTFERMLARLDSSVPPGTSLVIVQGGYNDVAARTPPDVIVASIAGILARLNARHIKAVLCGFFYPDWDAVGRALARRYHATFVNGSACYDPAHRGRDGVHMTAAGHQVVAARLAPVVERALFASPRTAHAHTRRHYSAQPASPFARTYPGPVHRSFPGPSYRLYQ